MIQTRPFMHCTKRRWLASAAWAIDVGELNVFVTTWMKPKVGQSTEPPNASFVAPPAAKAMPNETKLLGIRVLGRRWAIATTSAKQQRAVFSLIPAARVTHHYIAVNPRVRNGSGNRRSDLWQLALGAWCIGLGGSLIAVASFMQHRLSALVCPHPSPTPNPPPYQRPLPSTSPSHHPP